MQVEEVLALLILAVLYQVPLFFAAMACTWLVHEWVLHRRTRLSWKSIASRSFWTRTVWDHPGHFLPSYIILFIAFLSLLQLPSLYASSTRGLGLEAGLLGLAFALGYVLALFVIGYLALRARLRSHMA